jgi:predicted CoA-substrate-specific enzyme activase
MKRRDPRIGIFSTVPIEAILAAGLVPMDVNNLFVQQLDSRETLAQSDAAGLPRNLCAWTRGLYAATLASGLKQVVVVPEGDCTNNVTMARILERRGIDVIEFRYPLGPGDRNHALAEELSRFCKRLGTTAERARQVFEELRPVRALLAEIDRLCWKERRIPGSEARVFLLESTDMRGNPLLFSRRLEKAIADAGPRPELPGPAVALFGVPTALSDLQSRIESAGGFVALCETEHDFAMLPPAASLQEQYLAYAYPYGIGPRLERFGRLLEERRIAGVIVHAQSFCHHNLELPRVERALGASVPTLVVEGDVPAAVSSRDLLRIEAFLSLIASRERAARCSARAGGAMPGAHSSPSEVTVGLDLGSRFAKILVSGPGGENRFFQDTVDFYRRYARREGSGRLKVDVARLLENGSGRADGSSAGLPPAVRVAATGYGRHLVDFENVRVFPEIEAHAAGARAQVDDERFVLLDLGGQDTKAILVGPGGVEAFLMNDKCAAGSGRYVENMARLLGLPVEAIVAHHLDPVELTNVCATFGESEVIGRIVDGVPVERIAAGIMASVAERSAQLLQRLPGIAGMPLHLSGGLAESPALALLLARLLPVCSVRALPEHRFNGALGCLVLAQGKEF